MVVRGITDFLSNLAAYFSTSAPSTSGMSTTTTIPESPIQAFDLRISRQRNNFPPSSSLRDLSAYSYLDPESSDRVLPHPLLGENGFNSFSKEKGLLLPANPLLTRKKWVRVTATLCFLLISVILAFVFFLNPDSGTRVSNFYIVLDCGSTGTRIYIYQASADHKRPINLPIKLKPFPDHLQKKSGSRAGRAYNRMETEPGLDKLVRNISGLSGALNPLLKWAEKQIPRHAHRSTLLFLFATAGVRRLPSPDSEWLLENIWPVLEKSSFSCRNNRVRIISGMEEAYFGWVALNYQKGLLGAVPKKETFGALDLGGSSLQVTFETHGPVQNETSLSLSVGSSSHHLSAYSLSGYGLNDAFDRSVSRLLKIRFEQIPMGSSSIVLHHPCLQRGFKEDYLCPQCVSVFREAGRKFDKDKPGIPLKLVGAPKWVECSALAKVTVNLSEWSTEETAIDCELRPCALSSRLPIPSGKFYAMSGFFVVFRFFNLTSEATLDDVLERGREFCGKRWKVAKKSVPAQPFIEQYCFRAPYIATLLRDGLHIVDHNVVIGSGSTTWTLGAVLLEAGKSFPVKTGLFGYELPRMKLNPVLLFGMLILSLLLLFLALACGFGKWAPRLFHGPCLPLFKHNNTSATSVLGFPHWSPINSGEGRVKAPLSPTVNGGEQRPFGMVHSFSSGGSTQPFETCYPSSTAAGVSHSYSSGSLVQMQMESGNGGAGASWTPHRSRLQSRRSQSREDLSSTLAETHIPKA